MGSNPTVSVLLKMGLKRLPGVLAGKLGKRIVTAQLHSKKLSNTRNQVTTLTGTHAV